MKITYGVMLAGLLVLSPSVLRADDAKPAAKPADAKAEEKADKQKLKEDWQKLSPEERQAKMKEWREKHPDQQRPQFDSEKGRAERQQLAKDIGLDPEKLKDMPPEERMAKVREAADKKMTELKEKKDKGTLTEQEKQLMTRLEDLKKRFQDGRRNRENTDGAADPRDARKPQVQPPSPEKSGEKK
jgi:hypothetical protein